MAHLGWEEQRGNSVTELQRGQETLKTGYEGNAPTCVSCLSQFPQAISHCGKVRGDQEARSHGSSEMVEDGKSKLEQVGVANGE